MTAADLKSTKKNQWSSYLAALLFGAFGSLAFSPFDFMPAAIISLFGLLYLPLNRSAKQVAIISFLWGLGLFASGIHWVYVSIQQFGGLSIIFSIALVLLLTTYLALYPLLFGSLFSRLWPKPNGFKLVFIAPALWQLTEFLRGWIFTGFPWLQFGYSQIDGPLKGIAPLLGVDSITFILMMIAGLWVYTITQRRLLPAFIATALLFAPQWFKSTEWFSSQPARSVTVALVQGNIEQSLKWRSDQLEATLNTYIDSSSPYFGRSSIIIWPEAAIPDLEQQKTDFLTQVDARLRRQNTTLLTGIISLQQNNYYNSLIALGNKQPYQDSTVERYNKHHLVLFGEYVPFENLLRPLAGLFDLPMSSISRGQYFQPALNLAGYQITAAICYEIILGEQLRANFNANTDFLLTISNDAWFGDSIGPWQHFQMARMRALELGRPLIRSTNNGITASVDAMGNVQTRLPQFTRQVLNTTIVPTSGMTPYARFGSWPLWLITAIVFISDFFIYQYKRNK